MRILCATDRLPKSEAAIKRAGLLADRLLADVTLLHVVVPGESGLSLEESLQIAQQEMEAYAQPPLWNRSRTPSVEVRMGNPARLVAQTLEDSKADLLVLGPHRKRPLRDVLEDTIAERALSARRCPALIVQDEASRPYERVLLALDRSAASAMAVRAAESLVLAPGVTAQIVHAYQAPYHGMFSYAGVGSEAAVAYADDWERDAEQAMGELLKNESGNCVRYDLRIEQRSPAAGILHAVDLFAPDLLVMGTRSGGRLHRAFLGSVANHVLREVTCDTLIVPEGSVRTHVDIRSPKPIGMTLSKPSPI